MTQQDPSSPMDAAQQTQQMASFTMVEQITNMANENAKTAAVAMIGHNVTYTDPADKTKTQTKSGTVESVSMGRGGAYTLTVSGTSGIDPTSITQVG
jgi:flagellar hook assembly protein FlgD